MMQIIVTNVPATLPANDLWELASPIEGLNYMTRWSTDTWLLDYSSVEQGRIALLMLEERDIGGVRLRARRKYFDTTLLSKKCRHTNIPCLHS